MLFHIRYIVAYIYKCGICLKCIDSIESLSHFCILLKARTLFKKYIWKHFPNIFGENRIFRKKNL